MVVSKSELMEWTVDKCPRCGSDVRVRVSSYDSKMGSVVCKDEDCYKRLDLI